MQRPRHKILIALGCLLVALVLFPVIEHYRGKWALERWKADMVAKGEKFKIEDLIPPPPAPEDNGCADVMLTSGQLWRALRLADVMPSTLRFVAPGKAIYMPGPKEWKQWILTGDRTGVTNATWEVFADEMAKISEPLNDARAALKKSGFDANLNYLGGLSLRLPHLGPLQIISLHLSAATLIELHRKNLPAALENLEALVASSRALQRDRLVASQLVRMTFSTIAVGATWQALHTPGWNDDQLALLQADWQSLEFLGSMAHALEMERAMLGPTYDRFRQSNKEVADTLDAARNTPPRSMSFGDPLDFLGEKLAQIPRDAIYIPLWQFAWSHQAELHSLELKQAMIETARRAAEQKSGQDAAEVSRMLEARIKDTSLYNHLRFLFSVEAAGLLGDSPLQHWVKHTIESEALRELTVAAIALKRYELRHGKPAPNLAALVPEFLTELPRDYMDGKPLRYRLNPDGSFLLYSVGQDGHDDGGDATPARMNVTIFNLQNGRDLVWPAPASAEEIAAEESKAAKRN